MQTIIINVYFSGRQLRLTPRKPLWLDLQPVDIKSRRRHNWKSAKVVNSHLVWDPTIRQLGFDLPRQQLSLLNRFRTEQGHCGACRRKWRLTDCVLVARPRWCSTLLNPVPWQNWMAADLDYTLWMKTLFRGWPVMVHDTHTRRRRMQTTTVWYQKSEKQKPDTPPLLSLNSSQAFPTFPPRPLIIPLIQGWTPGTQLKEQELS